MLDRHINQLSPPRGIPVAVAAQEIPELTLAFLPVHTVLLLVPARELVMPAGNHAQPVIDQLPPAFPDAAAELLPLPLEPILVHVQILRK
jgi:hypothetical protein